MSYTQPAINSNTISGAGSAGSPFTVKVDPAASNNRYTVSSSGLHFGSKLLGYSSSAATADSAAITTTTADSVDVLSCTLTVTNPSAYKSMLLVATFNPGQDFYRMGVIGGGSIEPRYIVDSVLKNTVTFHDSRQRKYTTNGDFYLELCGVPYTWFAVLAAGASTVLELHKDYRFAAGVPDTTTAGKAWIYAFGINIDT